MVVVTKVGIIQPLRTFRYFHLIKLSTLSICLCARDRARCLLCNTRVHRWCPTSNNVSLCSLLFWKGTFDGIRQILIANWWTDLNHTHLPYRHARTIQQLKKNIIVGHMVPFCISPNYGDFHGIFDHLPICLDVNICKNSRSSYLLITKPLKRQKRLKGADIYREYECWNTSISLNKNEYLKKHNFAKGKL